MEYRTLRGTGAKISRFCLGTMTFGAQAGETDSIRMIHRALDAGVNFIDTADIYNKGLTETILGKALEGRRAGVVLAGKVRWLVGDYPTRDQGLARWHILRGVEASLKRLNTDCLDILFLHSPDYETPLEESLAACDDLIRQGKILYYGMSNYAAWQICQAKWLAERNHWRPPVVAQNPYSLITRSAEPELLPLCRELQVGLMVYNPLAGGLLTGKHDPAKAPAEGTRFQLNKEYYSRYWQGSNFDALAELTDIARRAGKTMVQLALQWLMSQATVDALIVGASRLEQLDENLAACEGRLEQETLEACDRVWQFIRGTTFQYNR
jgi:aryl-alcohol dehydrogenase-like predicted oxidoreductase